VRFPTSHGHAPAATGLIAALAAATLVLTAAGGSPGGVTSSSNGEIKKSAARIFSDARKATEAAPTMQAVGSIRESGGVTSFNLILGQHSGGGTLSAGGATFQIVVDVPRLYLKAGVATWTKLTNGTLAQLLANRWIQTTSSDQDFGPLAQVVEVRSLIGQFTFKGAVTKGAVTTYRGHAAIPIVNYQDNKKQGTIYVAATGLPYLLGGVAQGSETGSLNFSDFGTAKVPAAPKDALNLQSLEGGGSGAGSGGAGSGGGGASGGSSGGGGASSGGGSDSAAS
jgi:hypothetical protein